MKITLIAEGSRRWERFIRKWGLALLFDDNILFDTFGHKLVFGLNVRMAGVDLGRIEHVIISHEHWDHIGGLRQVLADGKKRKVYCCRNTPDEIIVTITESGSEPVKIEDGIEIMKGFYLSGQMSCIYGDHIMHELAAAVKTPEGLLVITGCAHPGIVNIVRRFAEQLKMNVCAVLGGFHLQNSPLGEIENVIAEFKEMGVRRFFPLHCTGKNAERAMRTAFGDGFVRLKERYSIEL